MAAIKPANPGLMHNNGERISLPLETAVEGRHGLVTSSSNTTGGTKNNEMHPSVLQRLLTIYQQQEFLILVLLAILLARAYPPIGAQYLAPHITATWISVMVIFLLSGISLRTSELFGVIHHWKLHVVVQCFGFGLISAVVFGVSRGLRAANILQPELADGMATCGCIPLTINMVTVLTKSSGGDEPSAIFNAVLGNMLGVVVTPALVLWYVGAEGNVAVGTVLLKLAIRVVLPIAVGQVLQKATPVVFAFYKKHKVTFKKIQIWALVFIVYTVFCRTFSGDSKTKIGDIFLMIVFQFILLSSFMLVAWFGVLRCFRPRQRVAGLFACTHKSVAIGIPLINAIYEDNPNLGLYALPLLIWHPMQLVLGTILSPHLAAFVAKNEPPSTEEETEQEEDTKTTTDPEDACAIRETVGGAKDPPMAEEVSC